MQNTTASRWAAGCGAVTLLVAGLATTTPAQARAETCRGINATLVGSPGVALVGTGERDVVVSNGASGVSTLAGDDLVCVTGGTPYVETALGSDTVDAGGSGGAAVVTYLGQGEDRFFGGPGQDTVGTNAAGGPDDDADVILTYGGNDTVTSGSAGDPNADTIDLGDGEDAVDFRGSEAVRAGALAGGTGSDLVRFDLSGTGNWVLDNTTGVGRRGDRNVLNWTAMERFDLVPTSGTFRFVGSDSSEWLDISDHATVTPHGLASVSMAGGDDTVTIDPETSMGSGYDGGSGANTIAAFAPGGTLSVHLGRSRFDVGAPGPVAEATLANFRNTVLTALHATAKGSSENNHLVLRGCRLVGKGLKGRDRVEGSSAGMACRPRAKLSGGKGKDTVLGTSGKDTLVGNQGRDKADGGKGKDRCSAEKRRRCERRA